MNQVTRKIWARHDWQDAELNNLIEVERLEVRQETCDLIYPETRWESCEELYERFDE